MMCLRNIGLITIICSAVACSKISETTSQVAQDNVWGFVITKQGVLQDEVRTFRTSLLHNNDEILISDGSYCGYHKHTGWMYPCSTDDQTGMALDIDGNPVAWDDALWFEKIDKDSKHALRAGVQRGYTLVVSSPAIRMEKFIVDGTDDTEHWGFHLNRDNELFISEPIINLSSEGTWLDKHYIFPLSNGVLYDRRSKLTVKVACGALKQADLNSVYFKNVMTSAYYIPKSKIYENPVMDGGFANPLSYYKSNSYESVVNSGTLIVGDMLAVPDNKEDIHLMQGESVTAISGFNIFSLDYATLDEDQYRYKELIPEIIVLSGQKGNIKSTVSLPAKLEPMKLYTVVIYLSTASVQAELYVGDWRVGSCPDVAFGETVELPVTSIYVDDWTNHPNHPIEDGTITNIDNE